MVLLVTFERASDKCRGSKRTKERAIWRGFERQLREPNRFRQRKVSGAAVAECELAADSAHLEV